MHHILNLHTNMHALISKLLNVLIKMCYFWLIECRNSCAMHVSKQISQKYKSYNAESVYLDTDCSLFLNTET